MDHGTVIASMKSWDGFRILGAFKNEEAALEICRDHGIDVESEEFCLDFVQMNKVSRCQNLLLNQDTVQRGFRRVHVYDLNNTLKENNTAV